MDVISVVSDILSIASQIYALVENVKANKKRCQRVCRRVKALGDLVTSIKERQQVQTTDDVDRALQELSITLKSAQGLIETYASANWAKRILKSGSHGDEFNSVNERLNDAFQVLSGALQVEQGDTLRQVFELSCRQKEDQADGRADEKELQRSLQEYQRQQQEKMEAMMKEFEFVKFNVAKIVEMMNKPSPTDVAIQKIEPNALKYDYPKKPFMITSTSEVYKGKYRGFPVAIKRYIDPLNTPASNEVEMVFKKEVETMRRFESPNILRMFGISVQNEKGPNPQYFIIMEYCEKGSLRQVLDSDCELSWTTKARMCRDAVRGLYRLHQTEEKSKVHGCINSTKFLVAEGNTVKLGGFELAKTETSLKKSTKTNDVRTVPYSSPQMLENINFYSRECEMYSFGIVMWEVATREKPFEGLTNREILDKVCKEKFQQPLPEDCPEALGRLTVACRAYDGFERPSAGVLLDELQQVVAQLQE